MYLNCFVGPCNQIPNPFYTILTFYFKYKFYMHVNSPAWADENQLKHEKVLFFSRKWVTQKELFSIFKNAYILRVEVFEFIFMFFSMFFKKYIPHIPVCGYENNFNRICFYDIKNGINILSLFFILLPNTII